MRTVLARQVLKRMEKRYDYDIGYALYLLERAPKAFRKFMRVGALSRHRERVPMEAAFTVQLLATMYEDCGPCTQLVVRFAEESKMPTEQIEAVLTGNEAAMHFTVALAYRFGAAVLRQQANIADARDAVRAQWGDKGVIDLAMNMQGARIYPMMKYALGFALSCHKVNVRGRSIDLPMKAA
jgi:hypothetical protein